MELGELISFYRRKAGITIDELSEKSGVPKGTITKIIGGVTKAPTLENVKAIAHALGVKLADFDDDPAIPDMFSPSEQAHIKKYRTLDTYGQDAVDGVLDAEWRRCQDARQLPAVKSPQEMTVEQEADEFAAMAREQFLLEKEQASQASSVKESGSA